MWIISVLAELTEFKLNDEKKIPLASNIDTFHSCSSIIRAERHDFTGKRPGLHHFE